MDEPTLIEVQKLTVGYDSKPVLTDVEMEIKKGEIVSFVGPNGVGKSTLMKCLINQLKPMGGAIRIHGRSLSDIHAWELARMMSVVLTIPLHSELMTVRDVIESGRFPYTGKFGILNKEDHRIVDEAMELAKVKDLMHMQYAKISDGQKQRVLLARALAQQTEIIVLDEPTSHLDIKYKLEFLSLLKKLSDEKKLTVLMSLHEVDLAKRISDRVACFNDGRLDRFGAPQDVFDGDYILELYHVNLKEVDLCLKDVILGD